MWNEKKHSKLYFIFIFLKNLPLNGGTGRRLKPFFFYLFQNPKKQLIDKSSLGYYSSTPSLIFNFVFKK